MGIDKKARLVGWHKPIGFPMKGGRGPTSRIHGLLPLTLLMTLAMVLLAACGSNATPTPTQAAPTSTPTAGGQAPTATPMGQAATPTPSFDAAAYFKGKTVTIISPAAPGGGYDLFARIFAKIAPAHVPGSPKFIVTNIVGGGLLKGLQAAMTAKPDGLTTGMLHPRWAQAELLGNQVQDFNLDTVKILGSPTFAAASSMWCVRRSVATSWSQILSLGRPMTSGETAPGNSPGPEFVQAIGGPIKNVYGYGGSSEIMAAFDRGELDGTTRCTPDLVERLYPDWVTKQYFVPIFYYGEINDTNKQWAAKFGVSNLPNVLDLVNPNADQKQAYETYLALVRAQRVFVMAPGVPDDIYQVWLKAFDETVQDPQFVQAVTAAGYADSYELGTAQQIEQSFAVGKSMSPAARDLLAKMTGQ